MVNFQTVNVNVVPDAGGGAARVRVYPWPANLSVDNEVRLQRGACRGGAGGARARRARGTRPAAA